MCGEQLTVWKTKLKRKKKVKNKTAKGIFVLKKAIKKNKVLHFSHFLRKIVVQLMRLFSSLILPNCLLFVCVLNFIFIFQDKLIVLINDMFREKNKCI